MRRRSSCLVFSIVIAAFLASACAPSAPASAPTSAPPAPATSQPVAAAQPTAAAQPATASPAKAAFPEKGKSVRLIVPFAPGGGSDLAARVFQPAFERALGTSVVVENKAGAATQTGMTEVANSKPDGYTIGQAALLAFQLTYLDVSRKATYTRSSFIPLGQQSIQPCGIAVNSNSPFKSLKDFVDAAKAKPGELAVGVTGLLGMGHLSGLQFAKLADIQYRTVSFSGGAEGLTALLGGHVDGLLACANDTISGVNSGQVRPLAYSEKFEFLPDVKTFKEQGYDVTIGVSRNGYQVPAGTPKEVVDTLQAAMKKATEDPTFIEAMKKAQIQAQYRSPAEFSALWDEMDKNLRELLKGQEGVQLAQ